MSTACYDRPPEPPREPIKIAGDLVRRSDKLSIEGAKCIQRIEAERARLRADLTAAERTIAMLKGTTTNSPDGRE